jgi:hypothetical protein
VALATDSVTGMVLDGPRVVVDPDSGDGDVGTLAFRVGVPSGTAATLAAPGVADGEAGVELELQDALAASSTTRPSCNACFMNMRSPMRAGAVSVCSPPTPS